MPPTVTGIVESALYVADLKRSSDFYTRLFEFPQILEEPGRLVALGVAGKQVLLLFREGASTTPHPTPGGLIPPHNGHGHLHLAFSIQATELSAWEQRLAESGVSLESRVTCPGGGVSLYFRDPDHHLVELITPGCWAVY